MNNYEKLLNTADKENLIVIENYNFSNTRIKGLYCDGTVALDENVKKQTDKACILAEELGHYHTTVGDIINQNKTENRKQELHARVWAYNKLIGLRGIVDSYIYGCRSTYETAEYLEVTEEFLIEAMQYYKGKYGTHATIDNYVIYFEPSLGVFELV